MLVAAGRPNSVTRPGSDQAPKYLTVSSSGPAGEKQASRMGSFRLTNKTHNKKPVWSSSNQNIFSNNGKSLYCGL